MVDVEGELLGGDIQKPAFCLLDGFEDESNIRYQIPIHTLPALLGRQHETDNPCFVSIGSAKAISRVHVRIDYGIQGGYFTSKPDEDGGVVFTADSDYDHLPPRGVFVLKLMSKNRILVNQKRVEQGQMVLLESERAIRIGPLALYFFPPLAAAAEAVAPPPAKKRWSIDVSSAKPTAVVKVPTSSSAQQQSNLFDTMSWEELWAAHESAETDRRQQSMYHSVPIHLHASHSLFL